MPVAVLTGSATEPLRLVVAPGAPRLDEAGGALSNVAERTNVFARLSPAQKNRVILALKHRSHVVGYMGDGINDAPSLHAADVGISVASAVDVAQTVNRLFAEMGAAQGGRHSNWFTGLPSPAAGMTLAVYFPFSQTEWYRNSLVQLNMQHQGLVFLIVLLSVLMVSNVKYPRFPAAGFRSPSQWVGTSLYLIILAGGIFIPEYFLFPVGLTYVAYGVLRAVILNLTDRSDGHHDDGAASMTLLTQAQRDRRAVRRQGNTE